MKMNIETVKTVRHSPEGLNVKTVDPSGIGASVGILPGDMVEQINGENLRDPIDYRFLISDEVLHLRVRRGPETWGAEIEKDFDDDLGIVFEDMDILKCDNACVFCFLHQMPKGMRRSLYYQDDDYRLSFLHGAYVTLTNLSEPEFNRIIDQRLSPIYISVHATQPDLRGRLLGRRGPDDVLPRIERLASKGIQIHTQVVLCPGLNDGDHLKQTVFDLARWHPHVASVGIVPVGLTRYRKNLPRLDPVTPPLANQYISITEGWQSSFRRRLGTNFVYVSDEFFLMSGSEIPPDHHYDSFPLVENGVGMVRRFMDRFEKRVNRLSGFSRPVRLSTVTGVLGGGFMEGMISRLNQVPGLDVKLIVVPNRFFGDGITVSGLLTGNDVGEALKGCPRDGVVLLPPNCVSDEGVFLDGHTPADLERDLNMELVVGEYDLVASVEKALGEGRADVKHGGKGRRPGYHPYISPDQHA